MAKQAEKEKVSVKATAKYVRISPFKVRQALDVVRGRDAEEATSLLQFSPRSAAKVVKKVLDSAIANAEKNEHMAREHLYVAQAFADEGPTLKRFRPRAMGRATRIRKRSSHITVVLQEKED